MTDNEIGIYNYLYAKEGAQSASKYLDHLKGKLTSRQREKLEETMAKQSRESPVLASALSLAAAPVKGVAALGQVVDYLADGEINENAGYNRVSHMSSAIRGEVSNLVESKWGKVGSAAYQLGMSMADSLANGVAGRLLGSGAAAKLILGSGVAADVTIESKDRGLSSGQAIKLGTVAGVAEALMESIGIDELLHMKATGKLDVLMESGLSQESMEKFAGHVMGTEMTTDKGKPTQYADYLASVEAGLEPAKALQMQQDGIDLGKIVELTEAGLNTNLAVDLIQQIHELEPVNGKDQVSDVQKWRVACNVTSDPEEQMAALEAVMEASAYKKLAIGYDYGVEPGAYVRLREILPEFDSNGSGSYSNDEIKAAIDSMSASGLVLPGGDGTIFFLTVAQKAALWQLWSTGSSAKNNPYDSDTGWAVLEAKKAE